MSQSKDPGRYPPHVHAVVSQVADGVPFKIHFPTERDAIAFRFALYGLRSALLGRIGQKGLPYSTESEAAFDEFYPGFRFCRIVVRQDAQGFLLELFPYVGPTDMLDALEELSARIEVQPIAGAVPVSTERQDDGEVER